MDVERYHLIKLAHLLLFVYWLGGDIGVFYSAIQLRNRELTLPARQTALRILGWVDQIPRYCLVLMLPVGYSLAYQLGVVRFAAGFFLVIWAVALVWLWAVWAIHHHQGTPFGERLRRIDLTWRYVLVAGLLWDAVQGLRGTGHLLAGWLALKFVIFALLVTCGILIRVLGRPLGPALRELFSTGSTPQLEARIAATFARTRPFVLTIWALLVVAAYVGISKPQF
jgi:hypothetical protein